MSESFAAIESTLWIAVGLAFGLVVLWVYGGQATGEYYAGYLIEKSLSVDNVFVWALLFSYFAVPGKYQHRVLFWGIFGALVMRLVFIFLGVALIERFDWDEVCCRIPSKSPRPTSPEQLHETKRPPGGSRSTASRFRLK